MTTERFDDSSGVTRLQGTLNPAPGGGVAVTDGTTTVNPASSLDFTGGAVVTNGGGGVAQVAVSLPIQVQFNPGVLVSGLLASVLYGGAGFGTQAAASDLFTAPPLVIGMGANVVNGAAVILTTSGIIPSTADPLDLAIGGKVTDLTGTNVATIAVMAQLPSPVTNAAGTLYLTGGTWSIISGADLSDGGNGDLVSAAGGVYVVALVPAVFWD